MLTLFGCVEPLDIYKFINNPKIKGIIFLNSRGKIITNIEYNNDDLCPQLLLDDKFLITEGNTLTLQKKEAELAKINVTNADIYTEIFWFCNGGEPLVNEVSEDGCEFTASAEDPLFNNVKTYLITVVGFTDDDKAYGTTFNLSVES